MYHKKLRQAIFALLLIFLASPTSHAQEGFFQFGYGYSLGKVSDLNQIIYMHNIRNNVENKMAFVRGGHGLTIAGGIEEDVGVELKFSNAHFSRSSTFNIDGILHAQDFRFRRNIWALNFYGNLDGQANIGMGVDIGKFSAKSRLYSTLGEKGEYLEFMKIEGEWFSGFTGGISAFGTYNITEVIGVRATYRMSLGDGATTYGLSEYLNAGKWSTVDDNNFTPQFKWSTLTLEILITLGGDR